MVRGASRILLFLLAAGRGATAQRRTEPRTVVGVYLGAAVNRPSLWALDRQPVLAPGTALSPVYDTFALSRRFTPGLALGVVVAHFPTRHFGVSARIGYLSLGLSTRCRLIYYNGTYAGNNFVCQTIPLQGRDLGAVQMDLHGIIRGAPGDAISPYLRAGIGLATYNASTIEVEGADTTGVRVIIDDPTPESIAREFTVAVGITTGLSLDYQLHFEISEAWLAFPAVVGPAGSTARAPTFLRDTHHFAVTFGLDFLIDAKRVRRF